MVCKVRSGILGGPLSSNTADRSRHTRQPVERSAEFLDRHYFEGHLCLSSDGGRTTMVVAAHAEQSHLSEEVTRAERGDLFAIVHDSDDTFEDNAELLGPPPCSKIVLPASMSTSVAKLSTSCLSFFLIPANTGASVMEILTVIVLLLKARF